jgi:hypothetical protein
MRLTADPAHAQAVNERVTQLTFDFLKFIAETERTPLSNAMMLLCSAITSIMHQNDRASAAALLRAMANVLSAEGDIEARRSAVVDAAMAYVFINDDPGQNYDG